MAAGKFLQNGANDGTDGTFRQVDFPSVTGAPAAATKVQQQAGTDGTDYVTPLHQQDHDSAAKAWVSFTGTTPPVISASYNISGVTRTSAGVYVISFTVPFASANYAAMATSHQGGGSSVSFATAGKAAGSSTTACFNTSTLAAIDINVDAVFFGRQ